MTNFDKEMQDALRADAEKLRATGVDVADPVFMDDGMPEPSYPEPTWADLMAMRSVVSFERLQRQREMEAVRQEVEALKAERDALREALREIIDLTKSVEPGADVQRFHDLYFAVGRAAHLAGTYPVTPNTEEEG